jgi:hypothetical protein
MPALGRGMQGERLFGYKLQMYYLSGYMPKNRINEYRELDTLPANAIPVNDYAKQRNCNTSYIYKLWREHTQKGKSINFEIVLIRNINFVIPV